MGKSLEELASVAGSLLGIDRQRTVKQRLQLGRKLLGRADHGERQRRIDQPQHRQHGVALFATATPRHAPGNQLEQNQPKRVDVAALAGFAAFQLLGRHIHRGANAHPSHGLERRAIALQDLGNAKVQDFDDFLGDTFLIYFFRDEDVVRFQVAVQDSLAVGDDHRFDGGGP